MTFRAPTMNSITPAKVTQPECVFSMRPSWSVSKTIAPGRVTLRHPSRVIPDHPHRAETLHHVDRS
jgi:hypothetical protein